MHDGEPQSDGPSNDPLLAPITIGNKTFRNRIMSASHACGLERDGLPTEAYIRYHEEKALGGIGLSMFGGSSNIAVDSPSIFGQLDVSTDRIIPFFSAFSQRMHAAGAGLMCQITHLGRRGSAYAGAWLPTIGPSPIRETLHRSIPREMDGHDIDRVVQAYAQAAVRCYEGGLDGLETLAGGHLIGQFLSPLANQRHDHYGGSLANRARFALQVHEAIRQAVGDELLIGIRLMIDEGDDGGLHFDESVQVVSWLKEAGVIDFVNAIYGRMDTPATLAFDNMPGMGTPSAPWLDRVGEFRQEVALPVFHSARITDVSTARHAVAEGKVDMAGMTRAHIADPHIVRKLERGEEDLIRPCVGATFCQTPARPACLHNVSTGREGSLPQVVQKTSGPIRHIAIIGAGPAGLEAARVCAERGHAVSLFEALPDAGGQLRYSGHDLLRRDLMAIVDWRLAELDRLGITPSYHQLMEADDVRALGADIVIVATGGLPNLGDVPGAELCVSTWDVLNAPASMFTGEVLVCDETGRHPAPMAAARVLQAGALLTYASIDAELGQELTRFERLVFKKQLRELGQHDFIAEFRLAGVAKHADKLHALLCDEITGKNQSVVVDQIVVERGTLPFDDLYHELRAESVNDGVMDLSALVSGRSQPVDSNGGFALYRIGDATASRNVHAAMYDAFRLCLTF